MRFGLILSFFLGAIPLAYSQGSPQILWTQPAHSYRVNSLGITPDGSCLVSSGLDSLIRFWNLSDGSLIKTFNTNAVAGPSNQIWSIVVSPNGSFLAAANFGGAQILQTSDGAALRTLTNSDWILAVAFSADGSLLATGGYDTTVQIWNTANWSLRSTLQATNGQVRSLAFSPTDQTLAVGYGNAARSSFGTPPPAPFFADSPAMRPILIPWRFPRTGQPLRAEAKTARLNCGTPPMEPLFEL